MVAEHGRDRDRDTSEERPDYGGPEEPVAPGDIVGAEEPNGPTEPVGEEAARKAAEEEAARKAAEEEAASKAAEEAAAKAAEEEAAKKAAEEEAAKQAAEETNLEEPEEFVFGIVPPVGGPYPVSTDQEGSEYTYQEVRKVPKRRRTSKEPKDPVPEPKEGPKKKPEKKEKEPEEEPEEEGVKGKKGRGKGRNWRFRSEEGYQKRKLKGLNKQAEKYKARGEELPEHLQELLASFGPGGVSSGSRDRPSGESKPAYTPKIVLKEAPRPEPDRTSDVPEPDPAVEDQRKIRVGQLTTPRKPEEEPEEKPASGARLRSRSSVRHHRLHRETGRPLSNYRRRLAAAQEAVAKAKARGSVRASIVQGVYRKEGLDEACSSCDDRVKKQKKVIKEFAAKRIAEKRSQAETGRRSKEEEERRASEEKAKRKRQSENIPIIREGKQRGLSLEREVRVEYEEYRRQKAARRAEAAKKEEDLKAAREAGERKEKKEESKEKKEEKKEEKEELKAEKKEEERTPGILSAVERAEAKQAAAVAEEYSYYSYTPEEEEEETEEEDKEIEASGEVGTPHFF